MPKETRSRFPTVDDIYTPEEKKRLEEIGGAFTGNPARNGWGITPERVSAPLNEKKTPKLSPSLKSKRK